ncbi:hypothetical protein PHLCEN_2v3032 [Hermanssonia centrifuga]|uniref:Uncharacterized protein n=1 Tax=Hermanssonia centrifuga TaxID=98765 RepID=A0A2R6R7D1_9APHY|nr:hypothetical protein PHLCEN_2v3032 [Hermanssonia centrifuga]
MIGLSAAVHYSWIAPSIARQRHQRAIKAHRERYYTYSPSDSPYLSSEKLEESPRQDENWDPLTTNSLYTGGQSDAELTPPPPIYTLQKSMRFSTGTQDGREAVWWFV